MTTDTHPPGAEPGGADEKKAAAVFTVAGFLLGGPVGAVIAALAVGIEQAFVRSGWDRPDWTRRAAPLTPEEVAERRRQYAAEATRFMKQARERAAVRRAARAAHRERMRDWFEAGKKDDKPGRPPLRNPWEALSDFVAASKARYRLFDEKMARGNEKVNDAYAAIGDFLRHLWGFFAGLYEGTREGWRQYHEDRRQEQGQALDPPVAEPAAARTGLDPPLFFEPTTQSPDAIDPPAVDPAAAPSPEPEPAPAEGGSPAAAPIPLDGDPWPATLPATTSNPSLEPAGPGAAPAIEGEVMAADGLPIVMPADVPEHMGPQGTTHLDLLFDAFEPARPVLASMPAQVTDLRSQADGVLQRLLYLVSLANAVGVPPVVAQMVAECYALVNGVNVGLQQVEAHHATATELTEEALAGLNPAAAEQADIHAQGASGDALNRVGH